VIGNLELDILTQPSIKHTSDLYITTTEIEMIRSSVSPILNIVKSLRDSKNAEVVTHSGLGVGAELKDEDADSQSNVKINPVALTYLRDAEDHIVLITESLDGMRNSCTNMIDLIFNTISAYQNESIKQLTFVTIVFLPLGFLTAYFTVPFTDFADTKHNQRFYWAITLPVVVIVVLFLARNILTWYYRRLAQRRLISNSRMKHVPLT
jgi:Mg2+ and Co2+ transporter CorA